MSETYNKPKKFAYIDALRGIAASGIIFHHVPRYYLSKPINAFLTLGAGGVPIFFMLSALTLFISFRNRQVDNEKRPVLNFFIRRFFRIAPLFYVLVLYFLWYDNSILKSPNELEISIDFWTVLANITFVFGLNPYWINSIVHSGWSIGTEMLFYMCVPLLFKTITTLKKSLWFFIVALFIAKIFTYILAHVIAPATSPGPIATKLWSAFYYQSVFNQLPIFALGILIYFLFKSYESIGQDKSFGEGERLALARPILVLFVILLVNSALQTFTTDGLVPKFVTDYAILYIPFIFAMYLTSPKILVNRMTLYLGKISYSLYLTHAALIFAIDKIIPAHIFGYGVLNYAFFVSVIFLLTVIVATITYHLIEKPGQDIGKKLIARLEQEKSIAVHHSAK
ncbi:acyltransferase [Hymenobacter lutimineralis]|uniref:Acyltransferase n=1 Tax=Hymenobacter lutimineralis TaxID=2606448 RepID=A0A5D6V752_9BACT|nr:acyltransferase [Hymenobacter lutimineralis]TYZ10504.1 acyltransferase [Hymenobacter lutimineralis]